VGVVGHRRDGRLAGVGATLIRVNNAELRRLTEQAGHHDRRYDGQLGVRQRRAAVLYGVNLAVLLSVVWAMVFKPTL
jgi:hypothetical protein